MMTDPGFTKAQSDNLPYIDGMMVAAFFSTNICPKTCGAKIEKSNRENYGDSAVGYVQLLRNNTLCTVKCKVCPDDQVQNQKYSVTAIIDEISDRILSVKCEDCVAVSGGCKHAIVFLMWLHRRSEEPSLPEVKCYWKKSKLSKVSTTLKFVTLKDLGKLPEININIDKEAFFNDFKTECGILSNSQLFKHFKADPYDNIDIHKIFIKFRESGGNKCEQFLQFASNCMQSDLCKKIQNDTAEQKRNNLWYMLRYARITASNIHEVIHCHHTEDTVVEKMLGTPKSRDTCAMERAHNLEKEILEVLEENTNRNFERTGLLLSSEHPIFCASPDGINENFVLEIKYPVNMNTVNKYLTKSNEITAKYISQVQLQMHIAKVEKALFCVADPNFEENKIITAVVVDYDGDFVKDILVKAEHFWEKNIFPILLNNVNI